MRTSHLVEALLAGLVYDEEAGEAYPELGELAYIAEGGGATASLQWALCVADLPAIRGVLRHAAEQLLHLVQCVDEAHAAARDDGCPLWHALLRAPRWLALPYDADDRQPDVALLLERDASFDGEWIGLLEALHQAGSAQWQWAIARCRRLQSFEAQHQVDLRDLLQLEPRTAPSPSGAGADPIQRAPLCQEDDRHP